MCPIWIIKSASMSSLSCGYARSHAPKTGSPVRYSVELGQIVLMQFSILSAYGLRPSGI